MSRRSSIEAVQQSLDNLFQMIVGNNLQKEAQGEELKSQLLTLTMYNRMI